MDAFDKVRQLARDKNAEALSALSGAAKAIDLVKVLVERADLKLYALAPTDTLLNGALAVLARADGAIYHVNNVREEELVVLIGHELGHFHVHGADDENKCTSEDVDVSAPSEASPVGVDRVAGYGIRERRELQANVFGRELLLPRPRARALYLEQGKTPAGMAAELGIPLRVARQQLIDALLLPDDAAPDATKDDRPDPPLDPSQAAAASFAGAPLLLEAGPGTGKTRTLVSKILRLLEEGVSPSSIVALTFSNKAALELSERVAKALPDVAPNIWTGTFHAFGLEFVRKHYEHPKLGYPSDVRIVDRSDAVGLLEDLLPVLSLRHYKNYWDPLVNLRDILSAISRAKDELVAPEEYRRLAQAMFDRAGADPKAGEVAEKALEVAEVYARYEEVLKKEQSLDFADLIMKPTLALEADTTLRSALQLQYRHVLVDEYQDVNRASARLLKALAGNASGLWVVGDARQSIYRFRGASSANMARFESDFPGGKRLSLEINYRSSQQITDAYCGFSGEMAASKGMLPLVLKAKRAEPGPAPDIRLVGDKEEKAALAASVKELEAAGVRLRDQAVLFRTNGKLSDFAAALEARGIPVLHLGSLFEREEIRDLLSLLSFIIDGWGNAMVRLASLPRYRIPLADVTRFLAVRRESGTRALDALRTTSLVEGLSDAGKPGFAVLAADLDGFRASAMPWDVLCTYLFERTDVLKAIAASDDVRDQMKCVAIWQFLNFAREPALRGKGSPIFRLLERIRRLIILNDERDLRQIPAAARHADAVRMLTMHGAKGLEFEAVHVPGMTKGQVPVAGRPVRCPPPDGMVDEASGASGEAYAKAVLAAEEQCLYFVAMSRARSHLRHYGNSAKPSDFVSKVTPPLNLVRPVPLAPKVEEEPDWITPTSGKLGPMDADRLNRFEDCPRRFLYTYILGLGGRQRESPFLKAHDCVYETLRGAKAHKGVLDKAWLLAQLEASWKERGPLGHPYEDDYRRIAEETISNFHAACEGHDLQEIQTLAVDLNGTVQVNPDQVVLRGDGVPILRRIKTGKVKDLDREEGEWIYTLYHLSGTEQYGVGGYTVEAVHLTSNTVTLIDPSARKIKFRKERVMQAMQAIRAGNFPPERDDFGCPRCPHFFYCPSLPEGAVQLP